MSSLFPIFLCLLTTAVVIAMNDTYDYGSVIDAGSSHSQLHVYRWLHREVTSVSNIYGPLDSKPLRIASSLSIDPISSLTTQEETNELLTNLSWYAKQTLASEEYRWSLFPIYLKATAGMRVLDINERENILSMVQTYYMSDENPFLFEESQAIIAGGEEESMFDWLTVNFLADKLNGKPNATYGALDMGGRSTQIAFAAQPSYDILAQFSVVRLWQETYRLYTHSFLTFGTIAIAEKVAIMSYFNSNANPCLNRGYSESYDLDVDGNGSTVNMVQNGTGDAALCKQYLTESLLLNSTECFTKSCSINGVYQPQIPSNMIYIAFSAWGYFVADCGLAMNASIEEIYNVTLELCSMTYDEVTNSQLCGGGSNSFVWTYCRFGTYMRVLLHDAYGFGLETHNIWFTNSLGSLDADLDWTQGSILRDSNWLPFSIDLGNSDSDNSTGGSSSVIVVNENSSLSDEGKAYQVATFVLMSIVLIMCGSIIYRMCKNRDINDEERLSYNFI